MNAIIDERSIIIPIRKNTSTNFINLENECSLKQSLFDPTKNSPPNEFMLKLQKRMSIYNNSFQNYDDDENNE
jgi:hypothetical protein